MTPTTDCPAPAPVANQKNVGILAMEVYTPRTYIHQAELEQHKGVAAGKYTAGLGQQGLAITGDAEDVNSICLTAVHSLLEKYKIDPATIGRLEVGTETLVDKSKSTKTVLMQLFGDDCRDIEGATVVNACYGGTAALLNAVWWCESDSWDGRHAIVVAADIATYDAGPARPTCGAGAVAVLVGRDAPLVLDGKTRATHAAHVWDFFKPNPAVEYPVVDGALSQTCYYQAIEDCYNRFVDKVQKHAPAPVAPAGAPNDNSNDKNQSAVVFDATTPDYFVFHSPYNKLVQKSYARLFLVDARRRRQQQQREQQEEKPKQPKVAEDPQGAKHDDSPEATNEIQDDDAALAAWLDKPAEETYSDKQLEKVLKTLSLKDYTAKMADSNAASIAVGNTYAASVFLGLASLVDRAGSRGALLAGQSVVVFSYGSGAMATMYRLFVRNPTTQDRFTVSTMAAALQLTQRLAAREKVHPAELDRALDCRAAMHTAGVPYQPVYPTTGRLFPGTYFLQSIDDKWRRHYARVPVHHEDDKAAATTIPLAPPSVVEKFG